MCIPTRTQPKARKLQFIPSYSKVYQIELNQEPPFSTQLFICIPAITQPKARKLQFTPSYSHKSNLTTFNNKQSGLSTLSLLPSLSLSLSLYFSPFFLSLGSFPLSCSLFPQILNSTNFSNFVLLVLFEIEIYI